MRQFSLWQPWASLMAIGAKRIETRSWGTGYRGWVVIMSTKTMSLDCRRACLEGPGFVKNPIREALTAAGIKGPRMHSRFRITTGDLPLGSALAVARLADCVPMTAAGKWAGDEDNMTPHLLLNGLDEKLWLWDGHDAADVEAERPFGDYRPGRWAWIFTDLIRLPDPIPATGGQGLRQAPAELVSAVTASLGITALICRTDLSDPKTAAAIAEVVLLAGLAMRSGSLG